MALNPGPNVTDELVVALDVGTTMLKAVLFDRQGGLVALARRPTPITSPRAGWMELDMAALWHRAAEAISEAVAGHAQQVGAISLCAMSCGLWLVDADHRPVRPAILWNDGRAADLIERWGRDGTMGRIADLSGCMVYPGFPFPLLAWMKANDPEPLARAAHTLACKDWLRLQMTGEVATDHSDASMYPYDIRRRGHSEALLAVCGLTDLSHLLPPIREGGELGGHLTREAAAVLGLREGLPVAVGMTDFSAATMGSGALSPGQACTVLGTCCLNNIVLDRPTTPPAGVGLSGATTGGLWLRTLTNTAGTMNLDWLLATLWRDGGADLHAAVTAAAAGIERGADGLVFLPYISSAGIGAPFNHPHARGQFFGCSEHHTEAHFARAVLEGVALSIRDAYEAVAVPLTEIRLVGGGSRNPLWCQIIADCTGRDVLVPATPEAGAWGAASVAMALLDGRTAAKTTIARRFVPDPVGMRIYEELFAFYRALREAAVPLWTQRARLLDAVARISNPASQ